jgi:hypothetical protein
MAFTLLQVGTDLKTLNAQGGVSAALSLPSNTTLRPGLVPRFAKFNRYVVMVNSPSRPITIDAAGSVRELTPDAPSAPLTLAATTGALSGTYLAKYAYIMLDAQGNLIGHSDYSPVMPAAFTVTNQGLLVGNLMPYNNLYTEFADVGTGSVLKSMALRIYRTVTNGAVYFKWLDVTTPAFSVDGSAVVAISDASDASLGLFEAPLVGGAPDLTLIKEWQGRLWGVDRVFIDDLRYTESGLMTAWSALNSIPVRAGQDAAGIMAIIPRRNALGVARREVMVQITGTSNSNFASVTIPGGEGRGCVSQESVIVDNDIAYFLGLKGIYQWDSSGISCISDEGNVSSWFTTDTYFNRSLFHLAKAQLVDRRYRLYLAAAGQPYISRWIEYDLDTHTWWGIHRTNAFIPTCAVDIAGADNQTYPMVGDNDGFMLQEHEEANDLQMVAIPLRLETKKHGDPEQESYFGELSVWGEAQASGYFVITPTVGELSGSGAIAGAPFTYNLTNSRQRLGRIGSGKYASLVFEQNTVDMPIVLYGYTIDPVHPTGRR